jgi:hypothetical protein
MKERSETGPALVLMAQVDSAVSAATRFPMYLLWTGQPSLLRAEFPGIGLSFLSIICTRRRSAREYRALRRRPYLAVHVSKCDGLGRADPAQSPREGRLVPDFALRRGSDVPDCLPHRPGACAHTVDAQASLPAERRIKTQAGLSVGAQAEASRRNNPVSMRILTTNVEGFRKP